MSKSKDGFTLQHSFGFEMIRYRSKTFFGKGVGEGVVVATVCYALSCEHIEVCLLNYVDFQKLLNAESGKGVGMETGFSQPPIFCFQLFSFHLSFHIS